MIAEFDLVNDELLGNVTVYPDDVTLPATFVPLTLPIDTRSLDQRFYTFAIDWNSGDPVLWPTIASQYPGLTMSTYADTKWRLSHDTLYVSWITDIGNTGLGILKQGMSNANPNVTKIQISTWTEFKDFATNLKPNRYIFRGQANSAWPLRTYFHRTGRANLRRFIAEDIANLHRHLSGLTSHFFRLEDPKENGAFHALAQHHGYPTPLLDWTASPFVAAYFAYRILPKESRVAGNSVRIFIFDAQSWRQTHLQFSKFTPARRHFSLFAPLAINNNRLGPQQAVLTIANVADIEGYVLEREAQKNTKYLQVVDLPALERNRVLQELAMMGITAGSMFPGLDGACEQMREQNFEM